MNFKKTISKEEMELNKLDWENDEEHNYRIKTGEILGVIAELLASIEKDKNYKKKEEVIEKQLIKIKKIKVPRNYFTINEYLINSLNCYKNAFNVLQKGVLSNDSDIVFSSGRKIEEGTAWFKIAKIRMYEQLELRMKTKNKN